MSYDKSTPLARFPKLTEDTSEIWFQTAVASGIPGAFYDVGQLFTPRPGRWQETDFLLDTGSQQSVLSGGLALELGLDLSREITTIQTVRGAFRAKESMMRLSIGSDWVLLACWIPWPLERGKESDENLLALPGILERFDLVLTADEIAFFRKGSLI